MFFWFSNKKIGGGIHYPFSSFEDGFFFGKLDQHQTNEKICGLMPFLVSCRSSLRLMRSGSEISLIRGSRWTAAWFALDRTGFFHINVGGLLKIFSATVRLGMLIVKNIMRKTIMSCISGLEKRHLKIFNPSEMLYAKLQEVLMILQSATAK